MRYFDPGRKERKLEGAYVEIPEIHISPELDDSGAAVLRVRVWLPSGGFKKWSFTQKETYLNINSEIEEFFVAWLNDPEKVIRERFGWNGFDKKPADVMEILFGEEESNE